MENDLPLPLDKFARLPMLTDVFGSANGVRAFVIGRKDELISRGLLSPRCGRRPTILWTGAAGAVLEILQKETTAPNRPTTDLTD